MQKEEISDPLSVEQKEMMTEYFKKVKGDFDQMKSFLKKVVSICIYYKFIFYIFENPLPKIDTISYEYHHIMPRYTIKQSNFTRQEIETKSNVIKLTPSLHLHLYAYILCAYSYSNFQDFIAIKRWKTLQNTKNKIEIESIDYFLQNSDMFFNHFSAQIDRAMSEMRKEVARMKSKNSADDIIKQLYDNKIISILATEGEEEETEFFIDPIEDQIECPIDLIAKLIEQYANKFKF